MRTTLRSLLLLIVTLLAGSCGTPIAELPTPTAAAGAGAVYLPVVARAHPPTATPALTVAPMPTPAPQAAQIYIPMIGHDAPEMAALSLPLVEPVASVDVAECKAYPNIRITWYELGSCCGKAPGHPQYGVTRSGLFAAWGMAAVQAQRPLLPRWTRFIVEDIGMEYRFTVADTGSETAFGSEWIDLYAPTVEIGLWLERRIGRDGRSTVYVCPDSP